MWYNNLKLDSILSDNFDLILDEDQNLKFIKFEANRNCIVWIRYEHETKKLLSPYCSITFLEVQRLWTDLCYEAISGKLNFIPEVSFQEWKEDHYLNSTINSGEKINTPNGEITSKFTNAQEFDSPERNFEVENGNYDQYMHRLNSYYYHVAKPFFETFSTVEALDSFTDNMDIYTLSCYLTQIPVLKKIILMHLTNNPQKAIYTEEYKQKLKPYLKREKVAAIISSIEKIESYFKNA